MKEYLTFDDVLITPKFSKIYSRKEVDLSSELGFYKLPKLPILSANMDTITGVDMAIAMSKAGGLGILHRFWSIEDNLEAYNKITKAGEISGVSIGIGETELKRALVLYKAGARDFVLDVAHGAQSQVAKQYKLLKDNLKHSFIIVGNFATAESCSEFWKELNSNNFPGYHVDAFKVGIGPGSACTTRIKTGCGIPQLSAIMEISEYFRNYDNKPLIIADGGMKTSGDVAKAIAAGADCVMLGGMLAGTRESPSGQEYFNRFDNSLPKELKYRGSASKESYETQGKDWATAEGEAFTVPYKGSVLEVLKDIEGGLKSAFTYVGAKNITEFKAKAEFVKITSAGREESIAHGIIK